MRLSEFGLCEPLVAPGRDGELAAKILGEALRAFEPGCRPRRPECRYTCCRERVDDAGDERRLRPDDDEIDGIRLAEGEDGGVIGNVEADIRRERCGARIAGRDEQLRQPWALGERPSERMLAPTGTEEEDVHG